MKTSQSVARKARAKKLKFAQAKKQAHATLLSLATAIRYAEARLKQKAKEVSAAVERFHNLAEDGYQNEVANPHLEEHIDFSDAIAEVTTAIEEMKDIEK